MDIAKKITKYSLNDWATAADSAKTEELKTMIVTAEGNIHNIEKSAEINEEIIRLKEELKILMQPIREAKDAENTKIKYIIQLLESRGIEIGAK